MQQKLSDIKNINLSPTELRAVFAIIVLLLFVGISGSLFINATCNTDNPRCTYNLFLLWSIVGAFGLGCIVYLISAIFMVECLQILFRGVLFAVGLSICLALMYFAFGISLLLSWTGGFDNSSINEGTFYFAMLLPTIIGSIGLHMLGMFLITGRKGVVLNSPTLAVWVAVIGVGVWYIVGNYILDAAENHSQVNFGLLVVGGIIFHIGFTYFAEKLISEPLKIGDQVTDANANTELE